MTKEPRDFLGTPEIKTEGGKPVQFATAQRKAEPMANIRKWLEEAEKQTGEVIRAIVVGVHDSRDFDHRTPRADENVLLSREAGLAKLDEDYDNGYGGADCYPMYAWTASWVYFIHEYDGSTGPSRVPRNPVECEPRFDGES